MIAGWAAPDDRVLPRLLRRQAGERPDGEFLRIEDGPAETFGQVLAAAERIAGQLAGLGTGRGDLVPPLADTSAESVHAWLWVNLAGAAEVLLNTAYRGLPGHRAGPVHLGDHRAGRQPAAHDPHRPLPARIAGDFERRFRVRAIDTWGMTEVTCVTMRPYQTPLRPGSCGRPRDDLLQVRIVDPETDEVWSCPRGRSARSPCGRVSRGW